MRDTGWPAAIGSLPGALEAAHDACAANAAARQVGIVVGDVPALEIAIDTDRPDLTRPAARLTCSEVR